MRDQDFSKDGEAKARAWKGNKSRRMHNKVQMAEKWHEMMSIEREKNKFMFCRITFFVRITTG